jgi:hypothetical protein
MVNWKQGLWRVAVVISAPLLLLGLFALGLGAVGFFVEGAHFLTQNWSYIVGAIVIAGLGAIVIRWVGDGFGPTKGNS